MNSHCRSTQHRALVYAAFALLVCVSCSRVADQRPDKLFATAFKLQRNLELRLPDVPYAPIVPEKRESSIAFAAPELAEAEAMVLRQLDTEAPARSLIALQARIYMLRRQWDSAVDTARMSYEAEPNGSELDLGTAYLARGLAQRRPRDLQLAIEHFGEALARNPNDPVGLFNRAIAFEKLFLLRRAEADSEAYLKVDASSGWAEEARERLGRIQQSLASWKKRLDLFRGSEEEYLKNHRSVPPEILLDSAITEWLPRLMDPDARRSSTARQALGLLAQQLAERHKDPWLSELLAKPEPVGGISALASAVNANRTANYDAGLRHARTARRLFETHSNVAGTARARFEETYALSRSFRRAQDCIDSAAAAHVRELDRFPWIDAQARMERAICAFHNGEFGFALTEMDGALQDIASSGYETLYLRGLGLKAALHTLLGNTVTAMRMDWAGLELYWQGMHAPNRAFQFYSDLFMSAEREQRWRSAYAFALEAVDMIALDPNRLTEVTARTSLGAFALRVGENANAVQQTELAANLLRPFGDMPSANAYRLQNLIVLASAYLAVGRTGDAAKTLTAVRSDNSDSIITRLALHRTYGLIHHAQQEWKEAREELLTAAGIARDAVRRLRDDAARLQWKRESNLVFRTLTSIAIDQADSPATALALWEWFRSAPVRDQDVPLAAPEDLADLLQSRLGAYRTASVVSWAQLDNRLAIWLFDNRGVRFAWSPSSASRVQTLSTKFTRLCSRPDSNVLTLRTVAQELYQALIGPIANHLDQNRVLLVEPDVVPGSIAFEALVHPDGRWLGEHFTIVTSPGLWAELALRGRRSVVRASSPALIVGNPAHAATSSEFFSPLPDAEREAEFIQRLFSSGRSLVGPAAVPRAVTASLAEAELFHFAGHARFDGESARLLLAGAGASLDSTGVQQFGRRCRLAVLSACSTAGPDRDGPWNVESLVQAFWRAGTPLVIASRWEVDSTTTNQLFSEFYTRLVRGKNAAEALRHAVAATRSSSASAHPFYWAAFHAFGSLPIDSRHL